MDLAELSQRVKEGKSLYGESDQPEHVQASAYRNSAFSQLKFREYTVHTFQLCKTDMYLRGIPHVNSAF
jgi:hypothetical protein